jgi:hypothetical protein
MQINRRMRKGDKKNINDDIIILKINLKIIILIYF